MVHKLSEVKLGVAAVIGGLTALWGWFGWLVLGFIGCMALDYVTGTAVALRNKDWASTAARDGLWHKLGSMIAVIVAMIADALIAAILANIPVIELPFTYTVLLAPLVLVWYMLTELGSIVENVYRLGAPVPAFLVGLLRLSRDAIEDAGGKLTGEDGSHADN